MDECNYVLQKQGWHKAPMWMLTPDEIRKMFPLMNMDEIYGGLFTPGELLSDQQTLINTHLCVTALVAQ